MTPTDLGYTPATELARLIRERALSPVEVVRAILERIERLNPAVNAYCTVTAEAALGAARDAEQAVLRGDPLGPLHGVPVSVKDLALTRGIRTMAGSFIFQHRVPDTDAPFVRRLRAAGAILLGKTTTPEFGWKGLGDSPLTGETRNPWNPATNSGGSSGGAAAAAALGLGPLHQGSDGAGSIRIPAAFCGIYGLKPSYGRVPMWPVANDDYASHVGPMTRTVADAALMLAVMAGPDDWDRTSLEAPPADYVGALGRGIRGLRVAWSPDLGGLRVDPEVAAPVRQAVGVFEGLGARVEEVTPGFADSHDLVRLLWSAHQAGNRARYLPEWRERMDPGMVACIEDGLRVSVVQYVEARERKLAFWDTVRPLFERYDLLLTPAMQLTAFPVGTYFPRRIGEYEVDPLLEDWCAFCLPANLTGMPAASVPCGLDEAGLPVGLQIMGRRFEDDHVLQAAAALEQVRPWAHLRPPGCSAEGPGGAGP
jgi:aspartyl-tRNA(Asn)/glutamyl-tRNA(Gln) amidotransferase subunit A